MNTLWNQPLSFWVLAAVFGIMILTLGPLIYSLFRSRRTGKILATIGTVLCIISLAVFFLPVYDGAAFCGRGAGAPGWVYDSPSGQSDCRASQWKMFWFGISLLTLGFIASAMTLLPRFAMSKNKVPKY